MTTKLEKIICAYCGTVFDKTKYNKRFCKFRCRDSHHKIKHRTTPFHLSVFDRELWNKLQEEKKNEF